MLYWLEGDRHSNEKGLISIHLQICWFWWQIVGKVRKQLYIMNGLDWLAVCKHFFCYNVNCWVEFDVSPLAHGGAKDSVCTPHLEENAASFAVEQFWCFFVCSAFHFYIFIHRASYHCFLDWCVSINKKSSFDSDKETYLEAFGPSSELFDGKKAVDLTCFDNQLHRVAQGREVWSVKSRRLSLQVIWWTSVLPAKSC